MKTYLIGMDGMDKQIIKENIQSFSNLQELSVHSLESISPPITVPAWACSFSGMEPDKLGAFDFQMPNTKAEFSPVNHKILEPKAFWNRWDDRTVLMDVPGAGVPELDGYSVGGFFHFGELKCSPESLADDIKEDLGEVHIQSMSELNSEKERRKMAYDIFDTRKKVFDWLTEKGSNVYFTVFRLPDTMMHHTDSEADMVEAYKEVDEYVGELLERIDLEEDNLFVFSDHGAVYAENRFFLNTWLRENSFLTQKKDSENSFIDDLAMKAADIGQRLGLRDLLVYMNNITQDTIDKDFAPKKGKALESIDFGNTKAFSYMTGVCAYGGIWVNNDRFDNGIVEDTEGVKSEIIEELEQREEVVKVHRSEELYDTEVEMFPDLVLELDEKYKVALGFHPEVTTKVGNYMHRKEGVLMAKGADIEDREVDANLIDIAPTLLHLHGYPVPDDMDGKVLEFVEDKDVEEEASEVAGLDI